MPQESDIQSLILVAITSMDGGFFWRQNTGTYRTIDGRRIVKVSANGIADIMGVYLGYSVAFEVKTRTGRQGEDQKKFQYFFEKAGGIYIVVRSPESAIAALLQLTQMKGL